MSDNVVRFTKSHEWVRLEGDEAVIGITDYAQHELGDIVFVELPAVGAVVSAGDVVTSVESVKSVSEVYSPVSGEVVAGNEALEDNPGLVNSDPTGEGWIVRMKLSDASEIDGLMTPDDYEALTKE